MCTIAGFEMDEREIRVKFDRPFERLQPFLAPRRVRQPELVAPVARLERDGAPRCGQRFCRTPGAREQKRQ